MVGIFFVLLFHSKASTTRLEHICRHLCFHNPGVSLLCSYPCLAIQYSNNCFARSPACGSPYISFLLSTYTHSSLAAFLLSPYSLITSSEKCSFQPDVFISCQWCVQVLKLISRVMNFAPKIVITLLSINLTVSKSLVGVLQLPVYFILSPPAVNSVPFFSAFPSVTSQTTLL